MKRLILEHDIPLTYCSEKNKKHFKSSCKEPSNTKYYDILSDVRKISNGAKPKSNGPVV